MDYLKNKKAYVIILAYNGEKYLEDCLGSLKNQSYSNYEVIVVDNFSYDGTVNLIKRDFPWVKVIENKMNLGFAKGNNIGIKYALENNAEYIILLNQDTVVQENFIEEGIELLKNPKIGIISPKIKFYNSNKIWFAGCKIVRGRYLISIPIIKLTYNIGKFQEDNGQFDKIKESDCATGCAIFIKKETIEKIGLLDESFFLYSEDIDWSIRCRNAGYKIYFTPKTIVFHKVPLKEDYERSLNIKTIRRRYYYISGLFKLVFKQFRFYEKAIWLIKLPIVSFITFFVYLWNLAVDKRSIR
jgi:GT2 family glycosyltransferase